MRCFRAFKNKILFSCQAIPRKHSVFCPFEAPKELLSIECFAAVMFSPEMFGDIMILKLAAELVQPVLAVVSAVTPHAAGDAPLTLKSIYGHDHDP